MSACQDVAVGGWSAAVMLHRRVFTVVNVSIWVCWFFSFLLLRAKLRFEQEFTCLHVSHHSVYMNVHVPVC